MTNKEFEDKKQDIFKNLDKSLGFLQNEDLYKCSNIIWDTMKDLKQLQPPKPPTCATCDDCEHHEIDCGEGVLSDCYRCLSDKLEWNMLPYIEEPTNFGCIHHSDYEVAE